MARSTPLFPAEDGWPYPDTDGETPAADDIDLDLLELRVDTHCYDALTGAERRVLFLRYGLGNERAHTMKDIARTFDLTHTEARELLGRAIDKVRTRLRDTDRTLASH
jgi:DNA-directed RNA polymerase sigma subunit (sigma70/sigma32)